MEKLIDHIKITKASACPTCKSYVYTLPVGVTVEIEKYLFPFGVLQYPLDRFKIILLDAEAIMISSMLGRKELRVKYKRSVEALQGVFHVQLAAYLSEILGKPIEP